jgi:diguanylate cyclase (GGDEF)-like protein
LKKLRAQNASFWPISFLALVMLAALVTTGLALINAFDRDATAREETVVQNGIGERVKEIAKLALPQVVWDDAVRNLDNRFDRKWAHQNIGTYLDQTDQFDGSYILDATNRPIFAYRNGKDAPLGDFFRFDRAVAPLIADVRRIEAQRTKATGPQAGKLGDPIQSTGIERESGDVRILTATIVQPDFGTARIKGRRAPILVTDMIIDGDFLVQFGSRFLLNTVHIHPGDSRFEADEAHVPLRSRNGRYIATIDWIPQKPGTALLQSMGPALLALIVFLVLSVLYFYYRAIRMTEGRLRSEAHAAYLTRHDGLTGLPNHLNFVEVLDAAIGQLRESDAPIAVLSIDLDDFERVSDTHGHRAASEYVAEAARRMATHCRPSDVLARFAADEFGLIMMKASPDSASALAARLCEAVAEPLELSCGRIFPGCSIGIVQLHPGEEVTAADALRQADLAMHRAKEVARGHFCLFESEMDAMVKTRRALEVDLRKALEENALDLYYQPQVDRRGYVTGVEALVRWNHSERGWVSPALFVPIAEQSGLIMDLGMFTLRQAFEDSRRWPGLKIAINVSAAQIMSRDFVQQLTDLVTQMRIDIAQFELEITEGILINDAPETQERLRSLRELGFALALDDFGTGYSSLSYLGRYPVSKIKIDRSFIANLGKDPGADAVVTAIIRLAKALKLAVIAEGVETTVQQGQLVKAGCFSIQGYLYSRAVPADTIDRIYAQDRRMITADPSLAA